jgi:hypothetical protein
MPLAAGQGFYISFELSDGPSYGVEFFASKGVDNRHFGTGLYGGTLFSINDDGTDFSQSGQFLHDYVEITTEHWYGLFIGVGLQGQRRLLAWDWEDPSQTMWLDEDDSSGWEKGAWYFNTQVDNGTVYLNDFTVIKFEGFK